MASADQYLSEAMEQQEKIAALNDQIGRATLERNEAVRGAHKQGARVVEIAKLTGLTRERIYQILDYRR